MIKYPIVLTPDEGSFTVTFPDIPEIITCGDTPEECMLEAQDALITLMYAYVDEWKPIPTPSFVSEGQHFVSLPPLIEAKLELYRLMHKLGITKSELSRRSGIATSNIERLFDFDHGTKIDQLEKAFNALGYTMHLNIEPIAA